MSGACESGDSIQPLFAFDVTRASHFEDGSAAPLVTALRLPVELATIAVSRLRASVNGNVASLLVASCDHAVSIKLGEHRSIQRIAIVSARSSCSENEKPDLGRT